MLVAASPAAAVARNGVASVTTHPQPVAATPDRSSRHDSRPWRFAAGCLLAICPVSCPISTGPRPATAIDGRPDKAHQRPLLAPMARPESRRSSRPTPACCKQWPEEGPPLAWKHEGIGAGFSSVTIVAAASSPWAIATASQWVFALTLDGGDEMWKAKVGEPWDPNGYSGPRCSPTIDGDLVYAIGSHGDLVCLQVADGKEVWRQKFPHDFTARCIPAGDTANRRWSMATNWSARPAVPRPASWPWIKGPARNLARSAIPEIGDAAATAPLIPRSSSATEPA